MNENDFDKKNIILLTVDCLRADHLGCMGNKKNVTPNIDALGKNGVIFKNTITNGFDTQHSIPSFLTSNLPPFNERLGPTIAEVLKKHGYKTAAFNPNPIILTNHDGINLGDLNLKRGFDTYEVMISKKRRFGIIKENLKRTPQFMLIKYLKKDGKLFNTFYLLFDKSVKLWPFLFSAKYNKYLPNAEKLNRYAIEWINNNNGNKFFLWIHYMDVHAPYVSRYYPDKKEMMYIITKYIDFAYKLTNEEIQKLDEFYNDQIKYTDKAIGSFFRTLKETGIFENSIIILSADHGDAFGEHGTLGHGGKGVFPEQLYDELLRVPLIIHGVGKKVIEKQVELLDLAPTICELLKISIPNEFDGVSLFSSKNKGVISQSKHLLSYRTGDYKLIINKSGDEKYELYDLKKDPKEMTNIYKIKNEISKKMEEDMINTLKSYKMKNEKTRIKKKIDRLSKEGKIFGK